MIAYIWPVALIVLSNTMYQVCAKSVPDKMDPMASLTVTYLIGAVLSGGLYFMLGGRSLMQEYHRLNWAPLALGIAIVGLEVGSIFAYRAGWQVSTKYVMQSAFISVALLVIGYLAYHEALSWSKVLGMAICLAGLFLMNR
jgi:drug/metabolite transporter (DMT)-like permease